MADAHDRRSVNRGVAWVGLASTLVGGLDLAAQVIILHLFISAEDYGIAALALTLFPVLDQATDLGLSSAVIQHDDHSVEKISTVFWMNMIMSGVLFGILCLSAPIYASWQGYTVVGQMLIVYGGKLIFQNCYFIPAAMMKRELRFKELSIIRIIANVGEFCGKVGFAWGGFKIWCFVLGPMIRVLITGIGIQLRHPWRPRFHFRMREGWHYVTFGLKTSASQILFFLYTMADYPVVNKYFGAYALGLYKAAYELVLEPVRVIATVIMDVAFPTFARLRQKRGQLVEQFISFTRQNLVAVIPFVAIIYLAAEEALSAAWGSEYATAAHAARILCVVALLRSLSFVVPPLLDGIGYPSFTLIYTVVASIVLPTLFSLFARVLGPSLGYLSVAVAWAVGYPIAFLVLLWLALNRIGLHPLAYLRRIGGIPLCTAGAMVAGFAARWLTSGLAAVPRLLIIAAVTFGVMGVLLAYFQGISPRTIRASMNTATDEVPEGPVTRV
jgi:O-antigen/teichoic acid export membrane protein